jgi:hypothetical protein
MSAAESGFSPSPNQLKYVFALRDAALEGGNTSDCEMQRLTKISRMTMREWKKDPAFVARLREAMQSKHDLDFELAMVRHLRLAIQGSVRSFEAVARVRSIGMNCGHGLAVGELPIEDRNYVINILVPRPLACPTGKIERRETPPMRTASWIGKRTGHQSRKTIRPKSSGNTNVA